MTDKALARPWRQASCSHLHYTQEGAESLLHRKQLTRSECSHGKGEHGEFACSFPTRSDSQKQWDFMSKLNEGKVRYLQAKEVRKEEAAGIRESSLFNMALGWPLHHRIKENSVQPAPGAGEQAARAQ